MHNKEKAKEKLMSFIRSDQRCLLLTGTNQYKKHLLVMEALHETCKDSRILFRTNALSNITDTSFLGKFINKQPRAGEPFRIGRNTYYADSFNNRRTWGKAGKIDFAIVYPIDAIARGDVKEDCIGNLMQNLNIQKIFLISWTDRSKAYELFADYINDHVIYDAKEEDPEYHKRMLNFTNV